MKNDFTKLSVDELKNLMNDIHDELNIRYRQETEKLFKELIDVLTRLNKLAPNTYVVAFEGDAIYIHDLINKDNWCIE